MSSADDTVTVWAAKRAIPPGTALSSADLVTTRVRMFWIACENTALNYGFSIPDIGHPAFGKSVKLLTVKDSSCGVRSPICSFAFRIP